MRAGTTSETPAELSFEVNSEKHAVKGCGQAVVGVIPRNTAVILHSLSKARTVRYTVDTWIHLCGAGCRDIVVVMMMTCGGSRFMNKRLQGHIKKT